MCADHVPIRPAAVRLRVVRPTGRMRIGALESLSDYRLTSVRDRPCVVRHGPSSAWTWAGQSRGVTIRLRLMFLSVGLGLERGQKRKPDTIAGTRLPGYRKAYNRLWISCNAFLFVILRFLHSRRKDFISSYLQAGGSFTLRTSLLISS